MARRKTVIMTGASQGIGAAVVQAFLSRGYNVVATSRSVSKAGFAPSPNLALVDGDIGQAATAEKVAQAAISKFGSIDHVVNNAGIFSAKPFTDYTCNEFRDLVSTNLEGFIFITQLAVKQILSQGTGGSVTTITASLLENPIAGLPASVPMITKGGLDAITLSLASEYAKNNIRFNAVAPGQVDTPLHKNSPKEFLKTLSPMGTISDSKDIAEAVVFLTEARHVTGEVLHVDGGEGSRPASAEQRLIELGIKLPAPPEPFGTYVEAVQTGNLLFLSGMLPTEGHGAKFIGRVGAELNVEAGRKAAHLAALNVLAVARQHLGSLDKVTRIIRLGVSVATSGDVRDQPKVADAASKLLQDVFGQDKCPCRLVFGVASLPLGTPVKPEIIFEVAE